jgi:hypothetical protein
MAAEAFEMAAELLFAVGEGAVQSKNPKGCLLSILVLILLGLGIWYYCDTTETTHTKYLVKGVLHEKLSNNNVVIESKGELTPFLLTKELYDNKNVGDSIKIVK